MLKPGGTLYLCTNGFGWYLWNIIKNHNHSEDYSPRLYGLKTIFNSFVYFFTNNKSKSSSLIMSKSATKNALLDVGFRNIDILNDKVSQSSGTPAPMGIYPQKYYFFSNVYDVIATK